MGTYRQSLEDGSDESAENQSNQASPTSILQARLWTLLRYKLFDDKAARNLEFFGPGPRPQPSNAYSELLDRTPDPQEVGNSGLNEIGGAGLNSQDTLTELDREEGAGPTDQRYQRGRGEIHQVRTMKYALSMLDLGLTERHQGVLGTGER